MSSIEWTLVSDKSREWWNRALRGATDHNPFQSFDWGEYKRARGWNPLRFAACDSQGDVLGLVQILQRRVAGFAVGWAPGGPLLGLSDGNVATSLASLKEALASTSQLSAVRFDCYQTRGDTTSYQFRRFLRPATARLNSGFTAWLDLRARPWEHDDEWSMNHRRNLRRAEASGITSRNVSDTRGVAEFLMVYNSMRSAKNLRRLPDLREQVPQMVRIFGPDLLVLNAYQRERPVSTSLVLTFGRSAVYLTGGTSQEGRNTSAGHALFRDLFKELSERGIERLDLGGLDPRSHAQDVDFFKLGFGGSVQERIGEWDLATNTMAYLVMNLGVLLRGFRG